MSWSTPTSFTSLATFTKTKGDTQLIDNLTHLGDVHLHSGVSGEGAGTITVANGTVALPSLAFLNSTNAGWYRIGANNIGGSIAGVKLLDLSAALLGVTGAISATTFIRSSGPTASGIGYATGAGAQANQGAGSGKATAVTLNNICGSITMDGAALGANTTVTFTLTNSNIATWDQMIMMHRSVGTAGAYHFNAQMGSGTATINVRNITAGSLSEAIVISFSIIKSVIA